jgi:glycosyltransferase involved in cell wall biosynthesis
MEWVFWGAAFGAIYSYLVYPALLFLVPTHPARASPQKWKPSVTIVIACRNEERRLRAKLANTLAVRYPHKEILVASDASDDASDAIATEFANAGVKLVRSPERRGKEHAQGLAVEASAGDIIVFTDAGTDLAVDSLEKLVTTFSDPGVGAVSSEDTFVSSDGKLVGEGAYVRYEMWLRRLESDRAGLVGMSGSFFAVRRAVLRSWDSTIPSDFACALFTVQAGSRAVVNSEVRGIYRDIADPSREYGRKVRTAIRGMTAILHQPGVLDARRHGWFAFQVWSHKIMRWLVPWFLLALLVSSWSLRERHPAYAFFFWLQCSGYVAILAVHCIPWLRRLMPLRVAYYFAQANAAVAVAGVLTLFGKRVVTWTPSAR